jgi:hypothetical protein
MARMDLSNSASATARNDSNGTVNVNTTMSTSTKSTTLCDADESSPRIVDSEAAVNRKLAFKFRGELTAAFDAAA